MPPVFAPDVPRAAAYRHRTDIGNQHGSPCVMEGIMGRAQNWWRAQVSEAGGTDLEVLPDAAPWTPPSWDEVVRDHSARVYRLAYRLTGNVPDAEDLTQEVFVRVFRSLSSYTPGTFEGWLHRITTNLFLDMAR